jgi:hypothetical protein
MFKNVNYILIKDVKKFKRKAELGTITNSQKLLINEIFEESVKSKNYEHSINSIENGFCYYYQNKKTFNLIFSNTGIPEQKAFLIIDKIIENYLDIKILRNLDDEYCLHYIYNIVDTIFEEDEYIDLRVSTNCQLFYVNKYREALLTISSDIRSKKSESNFRKNIKLIIAISVIAIGIILTVVIPSVI